MSVVGLKKADEVDLHPSPRTSAFIVVRFFGWGVYGKREEVSPDSNVGDQRLQDD